MGLINFKGLQIASGTSARLKKVVKRKQEIVDSEVLRLCEPLIPKQSGDLIASGVSKGGEVDYTASYARDQYYNTATSRKYDGNRGAKWFERMKTAHAKEILDKARDG